MGISFGSFQQLKSDGIRMEVFSAIRDHPTRYNTISTISGKVEVDNIRQINHRTYIKELYRREGSGFLFFCTVDERWLRNILSGGQLANLWDYIR